MRTPGSDTELAIGFLFSENIIQSPSQVGSILQTADNIIQIGFKSTVKFDPKKLQRHFYTSSSCGVCGKTSINLIETNPSFKLNTEGPLIKFKALQEAPDALRKAQGLFTKTGGIHAAGFFNPNGELLEYAEDVGRHNALDKLIGSMFLEDKLPLNSGFVLLSGRASFELVQKCAMAGVPCMGAIGAPSSLAVDLAIKHDITLIGFLKASSFNVYSMPQRIKSE